MLGEEDIDIVAEFDGLSATDVVIEPVSLAWAVVVILGEIVSVTLGDSDTEFVVEIEGELVTNEVVSEIVVVTLALVELLREPLGVIDLLNVELGDSETLKDTLEELLFVIELERVILTLGDIVLELVLEALTELDIVRDLVKDTLIDELLV